MNNPLRVLVDTNVILDWLLKRTPWSDAAQPLWRAQGSGLLIGYVPASVVTDIFYIARRSKDIQAAFACVDHVLASLEVFPIDRTLLSMARALSGNDFEDNVQITCAKAANLDLIVTRNVADFVHASLPVIEPPDIVKYLPHP